MAYCMILVQTWTATLHLRAAQRPILILVIRVLLVNLPRSAVGQVQLRCPVQVVVVVLLAD